MTLPRTTSLLHFAGDVQPIGSSHPLLGFVLLAVGIIGFVWLVLRRTRR